MSCKYIKRQITLYKLGLPIDEDLVKYYDYFIDNIYSKAKVEVDMVGKGKGSEICFYIQDTLIMIYDQYNDMFVDTDICLIPFENFGLRLDEVHIILKSFLETKYKLVIKRII